MIKLTNLLKEVLLTECFYTQQWKAFYNRFPQYIHLIKNDPIVKEKGFGMGREYSPTSSDEAIYSGLGYMGGTYCGQGPEDFNYDGLSKFFNRLVELKQISEYTKNKILALAKMYFNRYPEDVDKSNKQAEIKWYAYQYKVQRIKLGDEIALKNLKKDIEQAQQGKYITSPFVKQYNITLDDVLNYRLD